MRFSRRPAALLCFVLAALAGGAHSAQAGSRVRTYFLRGRAPASPALSLDVADTFERRARGLMFQKTLPARRGMLFVFDDEASRSFWMKDTFVSLDMVFADASCRIVHIIERAEPHSMASQSCPYPSQYVVEVAGGSARKLGAQEGGFLAFQHHGASKKIRCPKPPASPPSAPSP